MSRTVCLFANTIEYPDGGGHFWVYLNWALGLRALGCQVIWLEGVEPRTSDSELRANVLALRQRLERYGLAERIALCSWRRASLAGVAELGCLDLAAAAEADLLLNLGYALPVATVKRFKRSALVDIDPGRLQVWMHTGSIKVAPHHLYFTIGETVGQPGACFPDAGVTWHYTPPCVALDWWPPHSAAPGAAFSTVSQWYTADEWMEDEAGFYPNDKRDGFLPYLDLPRHTPQQLELALCLSPEEDEERYALRWRGWRVVDSTLVASTPWNYQSYIQQSRGEFSCVKPSCVRLQNAWISDRTLCYLASGKPAVIEHTGPSRFLPDATGLFRFRTFDDAVRCLETVAADYEQQCREARALAEAYFDAPNVVGRVLERALS